MTIESIVGLIVGVVFSALLLLLQMQHNGAMDRIRMLEERTNRHYADEHNELSRVIGRLEAKVARCEGKD